MKTKYFILSVIAAFFVSNILTTVWYMLMDEANYVPFRREEMNYAALTLNHIIYAGLMVYFYPFYYLKKPSMGNAFVYGILIAALMFIPQALVVRSIWTVDIDANFFMNTIAHLVIGGVMGVFIKLISNKSLTITE
ncbi:MAG: hypothetical protein ACN6I4_00525 [bacterium]